MSAVLSAVLRGASGAQCIELAQDGGDFDRPGGARRHLRNTQLDGES